MPFKVSGELAREVLRVERGEDGQDVHGCWAMLHQFLRLPETMWAGTLGVEDFISETCADLLGSSDVLQQLLRLPRV